MAEDNTIRLSEVELITALNDTDTIVLVDKDKNVKRTTVAAFETARASAIATKVMAQMSSGMAVSGYQVAQGGLYYTPDKYIGATAGDGKETVLLIAPIADTATTKETWRGCTGRFLFGRGSTEAALRNDYTDVKVAKAYSMTQGAVSSTWSGIKVGYCTYNSQMYLALYFPAASYCGISFSGRFSGNCVFTRVLYSAVTGWTDL